MNLSDAGKRFIKNAEGLRLTAYYCANNKLTIGYGHLVQPGKPQTITQEQADDLFDQDVHRFELELNHDVAMAPLKLAQNQFDALISFMFNVGIGAWRGSSARRYMIAGELDKIPRELLRWVHGDHGKIIAGLLTRRTKEIELFQTKTAA